MRPSLLSATRSPPDASPARRASRGVRDPLALSARARERLRHHPIGSPVAGVSESLTDQPPSTSCHIRATTSGRSTWAMCPASGRTTTCADRNAVVARCAARASTSLSFRP